MICSFRASPSWRSSSIPHLQRLVEGDPDVLTRDGRVLAENLRRELITSTELEAAARRQGIDSLSEVACARLEVGGALTFVPRSPNAEEMRHRELLRRLEGLERKLERMVPNG